MKKIKRGIRGVLILLLVLGILLTAAASTQEGLLKLQNMADLVTGDTHSVNLTEFGQWSRGLRENVENLLAGGKTLLHEDGFFQVEESGQFVEGYPVYSQDIQKEFKASKIKSIHIIMGACNLEQVVESTENKELSKSAITVSSTNIDRFQCFRRKNTLYIIAGQNAKKGVKQSEDSGTIRLAVPAGYVAKRLDVELGAGTISFDDFATRRGSFDVGAGVLKYQGKITKEASLSCSAGYMDVTLPGKETDYNYSVECSVGKISMGDTVYSGISQVKKIDHSAGKDLELKCAAGSISINYQ